MLPGPGSGGAERMACSLMRTLHREQPEARLLSLRVSPFGMDLGGTLAQKRIAVWHPGKRQGFDPRTFARLVRVLDSCGPRPTLSLYLQSLAQRVPSLAKREGLR